MHAASIRNSADVGAGTVVDTVIADPRFPNYFLNSHASIQGTSRPARYYVPLDENKIGLEGLELFSYW